MEIDESDRLTTSGLASRLRLDNSTLSRTIDGLVKQEQLERRRDDEDRRVVWLRLTRKGRATCRSLHKENDAICRRVMEKIPPSRRDTVLRSFETLVQAYLDCEQET
jgi:DNA-binding MarR family transcriptional regulator